MCWQVGTLWQSCVATVHTFPLYPDVVAFANFLAEQAGQPSVQQLHAAVMADAVVADQGTCLQHRKHFKPLCLQPVACQSYRFQPHSSST